MTVSFEIFLVLLQDLPFALEAGLPIARFARLGVARAIQALSLSVKYQ
jgi:hypothetical protein